MGRLLGKTKGRWTPAAAADFSPNIFVIELLRRNKLTFKYAAGWVVMSAVAIFFSAFEGCIFTVSGWLGFELPSNFIFFTLLCFFVFLSLFLTAFLCQQENRNTAIAQKLSLLEMEINQLKKDDD